MLVCTLEFNEYIDKRYITFNCHSAKQLKFKVLNVFKIPLSNIKGIRVMDTKKGSYRDYKGKELLSI